MKKSSYDQLAQSIMHYGSRTFYWSSFFFPARVRREIWILYAFVRTADDYVDQSPADIKGFRRFKQETLAGLAGKPTTNPIITNYLKLASRYRFAPEWTISFLRAMAADLVKKEYLTFSELEKYMYGSAEVIGLMLAKIFRMPESSFPAARALGKSLQLINFIRDVEEDWQLGRIYIPREDRKRFHLVRWPPRNLQSERFTKLIRYELGRYYHIAKAADSGIAELPRSLRLPVLTAQQMYLYTAKRIGVNPQIVWQKKVKPAKVRIIGQYLVNCLPKWISRS